MKTEKNTAPLRTALTYAFFGALWILLSDEVLNVFLPQSDPVHNMAQTLKGWLFICVSAALLYLMLRRDMKSLQESEERYRGLFENSGTNVIILDANGKYLMVNNNAAVYMGLPPQDVLGKTVFDFFPKETAEKYLEMIHELLEKGERRKYENTVQFPAGERTFLVIDECIKDGNGVNHAIQSSSIDITERKQAEEALHTNELRFRSLIEHGLDNISQLAADGTLLWESPATVRTLGYEQDQFMGRNILDLVHPDDMDWVQLRFTEILSKPGNVVHGSFRLNHSNGSWRWMESIATNLLHEPGVNAIVINYRDITERKEAELALYLSQQQMRSMIQEAPICIAMFNRDMKYIAASHRWVRDYGRGHTDLIGRSHYEVNPDIPEHWRETHQRGLAGETLHNDDDLLIHKDGAKEWQSWAVVPWHDVHGKIGGIILSAENTTERKLTQEALKASEERYRDLVENSMSLICTHDLDGNLLSVNEAAVSLTGYSREALLQMNLKDALAPDGEEQFAEYLRKIKAEGQARGIMKIRTANGEFRIWAYNNTLRTEGVAVPIVRGSARDITERKQAENALKESEERFHKAFRSSPVGLAITHASDGAYIDANDAFSELVGFSHEELTGQTSLKLNITTPEQRREYTQQISEQGFIHNREMILRHKSGELHIVLGSMEVIELNRVACVLSTAIDITERKQAEKALLESKQIIEGIINAIPVRVFWKDKNLIYLGCNSIFARDAGFSDPKEIIGKDDYQMGWRDQAELYRGDDRQVIESGSSKLHIEESQTTPEGKTITLLTSKMPLRNSEGEISGVLGAYMDITERKRAEQAIRENEERLRLSLQAANQGLYDLNVQTGAAIVNREYAQMLGYDADTFVESNDAWIERLHPDDRDITAKAYTDYVNGLTPEYRVEFRQKTQDGNWKWILSLGRVVEFDTEGKPLRMLGTHTDITERKQAEEELRGSEQLMRLIVEHDPNAIAVYNRELHYLAVSDRYLKDYGLKEQDIIGKHHYDVFPEMPQKWKDVHQRCLAGAIERNDDDSFERPDGSITYNRWECRPWHLANGDIGGIITYTEVTTERKKAEAALAQSEQAYRTLFENMPIGLYRTSAEGALLDANPALIKMFGYKDRESLLEKLVVDLYADPANEEKFRNEMEKSNDLSNFEAEYRRLDGTTFWTEDHVHVVRDETGAVLFYEGSLIDITGRKKAEELIRQYASDLEQRVEERTTELVHANRAKDEFLASMSHELRTPLSGILGFSEILLEGVHGAINEKQAQDMQLIQSSGEHLLGLINDVLDVSKIESGTFELQPETVSLDDVCRSSLIFIKQLAHKKSIAVEYSPSPSTSTIVADPKRLKQVLVNLLNNAVKFTPENGKVKLEVREDTKAGQIQFSITDSGIGIAPEDLQKLFKPFVQLDSSLSRQYEGTGLGLSLVKKLVELHGGSVGVESELGRGSCFHFSIPTQSSIASTAESEHLPSQKDIGMMWRAVPGKLSTQIDPSETAIRAKVEKKRILLAEDNTVNRMVTSDYLNGKGYEVIEARDGFETIKQAHEQKPDLILMDIQMPVMDGIETIKRLRAVPQFAHIPIIALTALVMPGDRERCLEAGANEYLAKPFSLKTLAEMLEALLRHP